MIKVFYGENRVKAQTEIRRFLGDEYEVVEGINLTVTDLPSLLKGGSLFAKERAILVRDLAENKEVYGEIVKYLDTPHKVVVLENKIDKRSAIYKSLKNRLEFREFTMPREQNAGVVFDVYKTAKTDGKKAVEMVKKIESEQDPMMFLGLMVSQALKDYAMRSGAREKRALKELSKLDMQLKQGSTLQPWSLISAFLLRLSSL